MQYITATYTVEYLETTQFAVPNIPDNFSNMTADEQFAWLDANAVADVSVSSEANSIGDILSINISEGN